MPQSYEYWDDSQNMFQQSQQPGGQPSGQQPPTWQQPPTQGQQPSGQQPPSQQQPPQQPPRNTKRDAQSVQVGQVPAPPAQQVAYVAVPQKKGHGWIVALVLVVCLFAFAAFCVKSCTDLAASGGMYGAVSAGPASDSVAVIDMDGAIQYDGTACSPEGLKALLDRARDNDHIKAVVLRVNSGGGTATAGEEMAGYVRDFKKPVVVSSASINASAAYEVSSQANYIYVAKSTEIGSIGTAMQITDISGLLDMLGISMDTITSSDSKDSSYGYRPLTNEEREHYQHMIDQINDVFIEFVAEGRAMPVEDVRALATGLSYTGIDAVENGLADEFGTLEDAMDKAAELAGISSYAPYDLGFTSYDLASLYSLFGGQQQQQNNVGMSFPIACALKNGPFGVRR